MKLAMVSRPCFLCNDKQHDDITYFSSGSSTGIQSDADSFYHGSTRPPYSLRSFGKKSRSFRLSTSASELGLSLPRAGSIESTKAQDKNCARSKLLLNVAKDAFRSFRITGTRKNLTTDARKALNLDDKRSIALKFEQRRKDECSFEFSAMDESMSAHSIMDDLQVEEYVDPYTEFFKMLERKKGYVEEIEIDMLTQLPSISINISQRDLMKNAHRRNSLRNSYLSTDRRTNLETRSMSCRKFERESSCFPDTNERWGVNDLPVLISKNSDFKIVAKSDFGDSAMRKKMLQAKNLRPQVSRVSSIPDLSRLEALPVSQQVETLLGKAALSESYGKESYQECASLQVPQENHLPYKPTDRYIRRLEL